MNKRVKGQGSRVKENVYAVILVGGKGKRLRPLSTDAKPKAFLSVTRNRKTMFANTAGRICKIVPTANIVVVANKAHAALVRKDAPGLKKANLMLEPVSRNTAPAVAWAASLLYAHDEDAIMVVLPSDQYITDEKRYLSVVRAAIDFVRAHESAFVVVGIKPTFPATQYGYIKVKGQGSRGKGIMKAERFTEKPDLALAKEYISGKRYLWNAGMFIFSARAILDAVKRCEPRIYNGLRKAGSLAKRYAALPDVSIDFAVMERSRNIYCVRGSFGWQDMGSFDALRSILRREKRRYVERDGKILKVL